MSRLLSLLLMPQNSPLGRDRLIVENITFVLFRGYCVKIKLHMVTSSIYAPCCVVVCVLVLYRMRSQLLLISLADTVRDIVSRWGRVIQVLAANSKH